MQSENNQQQVTDNDSISADELDQELAPDMTGQSSAPGADVDSSVLPFQISRLSFSFAKKHAVVLESKAGQIVVVHKEGLNSAVLLELQRYLNVPFSLEITSDDDFERRLGVVYQGDSAEAMGMVEGLGDELDLASLADSVPETEDLLEQDDNAPIVRLINALLTEAIKESASDIHIETYEKKLVVRFRVDGVLREVVQPKRALAPLLVSRIKVMAKLDIAEKRVPQDGRIPLRLGGREVDVRVSTMPSSFGERIVMRLLDKQAGRLQLKQLDMSHENMRDMMDAIHQPHGIILVTGPTGSGKTTTLYGALSELNTAKSKIITVEDPVEYRLPRVNQVQVHPNIGLDFSSVLRASLRQDPDILLVGEIRDKETADIALRAAMTGHFVLSTLHTNDAVSSAMRLTDIGIEGYLVASALNGILAQRLVRKICENCTQEYFPTDTERLWLDARGEELGLEDISLQKGRGCTYCNNTGYKGRTGIFELLEINENMADALRRNDSAAFTIAAKTDPHYQPLAYSALELAIAGKTTLDEVFRVTEQLDESIYLDAPEVAAESSSIASGGLELE